MNPTLLGFIRKEFIQALRDPRMRVVLFFVPVIQLTLFGVALSNEVKNVRLAAVYGPKDSLARQVVDHAYGSGWFLPAATSPSENDPFRWIQSGDADAVLIAPGEGLEHEIERGHGELQLLVNATNVLQAQQIETYVRTILNQTLRLQQLHPISFDVRVLYNPSLITSVYMVPGVMSMILTVLTIILTSMSLAREKEVGTFEMLISAPVKKWEILVGKTLPYIVLAMIDVPLIVGAAVLIFQVPLRGPIWMLLLAALVFVFTTVGIGTLISTIAKSQQQAMMGGFIFLFPSILLSGVMYPIENMPGIIKVIAHLNPLKYFVTLLRNIMLKGGDPMVVAQNITALALMGILIAWISFRRFHRTLE